MGLTLIVKIKPGAFKDEIIIDGDDNWIIKIKEKPIDGAANDYLIKFLAKQFNRRKSEIIIEKGLSSRIKKIRLNISSEEFAVVLNKYKK